MGADLADKEVWPWKQEEKSVHGRGPSYGAGPCPR